MSTALAAPQPIHFVMAEEEAAKAARTSSWDQELDPFSRKLFQQRLRLCCLVAAFPFALFSVASATGYIDLFGRDVVGRAGILLSVSVLMGLVAACIALTIMRTPTATTLRVLEIAMFGAMGLFSGYWQFALLTSNTLMVEPSSEAELRQRGFTDANLPDAFRASQRQAAQQEQFGVLAAALITHFNWFALIVFHGVLVPNTLSRGVGVALAMLMVAFTIDGIAVALHPPTRTNTLMLGTLATAMLLAAAGLSIFGTAKTAALRQEVESAKQAVRELGQYRLRRKLGHGGMGEVYLAEHRFLKRPCAVKRIHPRFLNNPEQVKRFEREVQTTAQLRHPNTVEVYDYGRADDGTFYYVMEYLPGLSLEDMVNKYGPLSADRVVHVLRQVCGALREAHRIGLVHRDIKPSNIIVIPQGSPHDQAKVVDFGLVQSLAEEASSEAKITRDGLIVGTPEYMSPEQAQGLPLDERSDLFSLGTVAYYILTGKEPFHRETAMRTLLAVVNEEPKPIQDFNPYVPTDLAAVVAKCLTKTLEGRFSRAFDLEQALTACGCADRWSEKQAREWWDARTDLDLGTGTDLNSLPVESVAKQP
ncbi:MAG: serine/threonine-protein kinase [Gemmataceae bacterium]